MAKNNTYYFSHDGNARNDDKIIAVRMRLGAEGYGIYFMLIERLLNESEYMSVKDYNIIAFDLRVPSDKVKSIVEEFGLFSFTEDGKRFYSESLLRRMEKRDEKSKIAREKVAKRWNKGKNESKNTACNTTVSNNDTTVIQQYTENDTIKGKEIKGNKIKEKNISSDDDIEDNTSFVNSSSTSINDFGECRFYALDELLMRMQSDESWIRTVSENFKLHKKQGGAAAMIDAFIEELRLRGVKAKTESDAKNHFINWIRSTNRQNEEYIPRQKSYHGTGKPGQSYNDGKASRDKEFAEHIASKLANGDSETV